MAPIPQTDLTPSSKQIPSQLFFSSSFTHLFLTVDLAYTTLDAAIIAESQYEEDMLDVTAIVDESAGADGILVKNDINSIADLKGKTVGVSINQTSHYLLLHTGSPQ